MRYIRVVLSYPTLGYFVMQQCVTNAIINLYMSYNFRPTLKINCEVGEKLDTIIPKLDKRVNR